jgi:hypothetical protein
MIRGSVTSYSCRIQATAQDIEIIYDVCWMLSPMQIQRMCTNYYVADYEVRAVMSSFLAISDINMTYSEPHLSRNPPCCSIKSPS